MKELFVKYDEGKQGVTKDQLLEMLRSLMKDECIIGKIPALTDEEVANVFDPWEITTENKCSW